MEITENEIKRLASLSRLQFNDDEMQKIAEDMSSIVSYVNELQNNYSWILRIKRWWS